MLLQLHARNRPKAAFNARVKNLRVEYLATAPMMFDETSPSCDEIIAKIAML